MPRRRKARSLRSSAMDSIETLAEMFERFPGIGPRQARRFVHFLLRSSPASRRALAQAITALADSISRCDSCMRFHGDDEHTCALCTDTRREDVTLVVVASDTDLSAFERAGTYHGRYFVLGGVVSLATEKRPRLHERELVKRVEALLSKGLSEIILAFPANPEGDTTAAHVRSLLSDAVHGHDVHITALGRGLSTGSELEYADPDTIRNAFESRR